MAPGELYRHDQFYPNPETGELEPKYFLVLAFPSGGDIVARLLTSRQHGRPEDPPCYHGDPYPGYFLGVLGGALGSKSWLDLRYLPDFDRDDIAKLTRRGRVHQVGRMPAPVLLDALACAAAADDTTQQQERAIRDTLAALR